MPEPEVSALLDAARTGDRRAIARLLTLVERDELDEDVAPGGTGQEPRWVMGVTGPPGVGKSSLVAGLITELRRRAHSVAVLAIDPSSPRSGGALLGDRIRMQDHDGDDGVYIRSMAARDQLGGVAAATPRAIDVLAAVGFDVIIIETVGVGQSELDVAELADTTLVVLAPGAGDGVQAAKAGILEIADVLVVNKADLAGAGQLEQALRSTLEIGHAAAGGATSAMPPIVRTVAVRDEGIEELVDAASRQRGATAAGVVDRRHRAARHIERAVVRRVRAELANPQRQGADPPVVDAVIDGSMTPEEAADQIMLTLADHAGRRASD